MSSLTHLLDSLHILLSDAQKEQFSLLLERFLYWNNQLNLSSIKDEPGIIEKHFQDSLLGFRVLQNIYTQGKILDLGSGNGFPVLPLAILFPNTQFYALESVEKKLHAIEDMAKYAGISNLAPLLGRIEHFAQNPEYRESFAVVTARALAPYPVLLEYTLPFIAKGGNTMLYEGPSIQEDLKKYPHLETLYGAKFQELLSTSLGTASRFFLILRKEHTCPSRFPRKAGIPHKRPILSLERV